MPSEAKITKEMILQTVLKITQTIGFDTVNARSIVNHLQCSTCPIFTCYQNMGELKIDFPSFVYEYYEQSVIDHGHLKDVSPYLPLPLSYIAFAQEETHLFKPLFIHDMDLNMTEAGDFYREINNEKRAKVLSGTVDIELERAKVIFLGLFLYAYGITVPAVTEEFTLNRAGAEVMVQNALIAFIEQEKLDWDLSF